MYLTMNEIKALDKEIISFNQLEEIEESEHVSFVELLGQSGRYFDCVWYSVELEDDTDIDVYIKFSEEYDNGVCEQCE